MKFIGSFKITTAMHCYAYIRDYKPATYLVSFGSREEAIEWGYDSFETDTDCDLKQVLLERWLREK